jgi:hypothetical protein
MAPYFLTPNCIPLRPFNAFNQTLSPLSREFEIDSQFETSEGKGKRIQEV